MTTDIDNQKLRGQISSLTADLDDARAKLRREQDARAELRLELDRMRPVYEAALRLRAITKRAEQQPTPALLNQQIIDNANAFRELFDAVDAMPADALNDRRQFAVWLTSRGWLVAAERDASGLVRVTDRLQGAARFATEDEAQAALEAVDDLDGGSAEYLSGVGSVVTL